MNKILRNMKKEFSKLTQEFNFKNERLYTRQKKKFKV